MMADETTAHAPGIYFNMPDKEYFADPALGSGDVRRLLRGPYEYWFDSVLNPNKPPDSDTLSRLRGRAIHKIVLEGEAAFDALYTRRKDDEEGATPAEKGALTKKENARAAVEGRDLLHGTDYDRALITGAMVRGNPHLTNVFDAGGESEVSVFWTRKIDGAEVPCKARIDKLRPRAVGDLKSIANQHGDPIGVACRRAIASYRYDLQAAHYLEGRAAVPHLFDVGQIKFCGAEDLPSGTVRRLVAFCEAVSAAADYAFVFVFFQTEAAPMTWGAVLSPTNPIVEFAGRQREEALRRYAQAMEAFGPDTPWIIPEPLAELDMSEMPAWYGRN